MVIILYSVARVYAIPFEFFLSFTYDFYSVHRPSYCNASCTLCCERAVQISVIIIIVIIIAIIIIVQNMFYYSKHSVSSGD